MARLNADILLRIMELADVATLMQLIHIPQRYRKSIMKNIYLTHALSPNKYAAPGFGNPHILHTEEDGFGHRLSHIRMVISADSFMALRMFERRRFEINILLRSGFLSFPLGANAPNFLFPVWDRREDLLPGLERAFYHLDAIADTEALILHRQEKDLQGKLMKTYHSIDHVLVGDVSLEIGARQAKWGECRYKTWAAITEITRSFQFQYILSLSDADLYYLMALLLLAREGWCQWARMRDWDSRADIFEYHEMVFMETLMRHGSGFLYSLVRGFGTRATHWSGVEEVVSEDLRGQSGMPRRSLWAALWATAHVRGWQLPRR